MNRNSKPLNSLGGAPHDRKEAPGARRPGAVGLRRKARVAIYVPPRRRSASGVGLPWDLRARLREEVEHGNDESLDALLAEYDLC